MRDLHLEAVTTPPMRPSSNQIRSPLRTCPITSGSVHGTVAGRAPLRPEPSVAGPPIPARVTCSVSPRHSRTLPAGAGNPSRVVLRGPFPLRRRRSFVSAVR
jgi:hypothetical protein